MIGSGIVYFVILALSGLNITFGRPLLLPLMRPESFTAFSEWAKYAHNYTLGVVLIFLMWLGGNLPMRVDIEWLKRGGGMIGHNHPPAHRFNAGQKLIYWVVVLGGGGARVNQRRRQVALGSSTSGSLSACADPLARGPHLWPQWYR